MRKALLVTAASVFLLSGCHRHKVARNPPPPPAPNTAPGDETAGAPTAASPIAAGSPAPASGETGLASWYGHPYHGRASASGEIYDMEQMTAAHRTLPFGAMVRVHDLDNQKSVDVRINDRGPFVDGRIIDLSHAAARVIEMIGPGIAQVQLEILSLPSAVASPYFGVQVGAFRNRDNAEHLRREMEAKYGSARLVSRADTPGFWHVVVGRETTQDGASTLANRIRSENSSISTALVVRIDSV
jgi:rare lipoprotein A